MIAPFESLETPIQFIKGVGPQRADILQKIGIETLEDLLTYYPRDHQDRRFTSMNHAIVGRKAAFKGEVLSIDIKRVGKMLGQARVFIKEGDAQLEAVWFKHISYRYDVFSSLRNQIEAGKQLFIFGMVEAGPDGLSVNVDEFEAGSPASVHFNRIVPVYPLTEGLNDRWLRGLMAQIVQRHAPLLQDPLPQGLLASHKLMPLGEAVLSYHFPNDLIQRDKARERLAFDEFFLLELVIGLNRQTREQQSKGFSSLPHRTLLTPFKNKLGYDFTKSQIKVINEIFRDMALPTPMNRLLQGDVGSGKTVVALSATLLAIENKKQVAFLAPTEILAAQHALSIGNFFHSLPVRWALLTGSTSDPERKKILKSLKEGDVPLLIGTHAMLEEDVQFKELGLVIIDEQHRFGVRQRERLLKKSAKASAAHTPSLFEHIHPDVLIMTATPIPRTLCLTLYGDLDVSVIDEMPKGRQSIKTFPASEEDAMREIEKTVVEGRQAYVVFPLIEESELLSKRRGAAVRSAKKEFQLIADRFPQTRVGLLHGQMSSIDKTAALDAFRRGDMSILVATPVIEVGIDIPNATTIVIVNPERFGLAQLHQLRGRVGRGSHPSQCVLVIPADAEEPLNPRLETFCHLSDGFNLAEEDLKLRGPGEVLGEAQHGLPFFKVGNLLKDGWLIQQTREATRALIQGEIPLTMKEFGFLNRTLQKRFGNKIKLSSVG